MSYKCESKQCNYLVLVARIQQTTLEIRTKQALNNNDICSHHIKMTFETTLEIITKQRTIMICETTIEIDFICTPVYEILYHL